MATVIQFINLFVVITIFIIIIILIIIIIIISCPFLLQLLQLFYHFHLIKLTLTNNLSIHIQIIFLNNLYGAVQILLIY